MHGLGRGWNRPIVEKRQGGSSLLYFAEPRSDGGSNAKIANILEYGKHGQPPKPFMKPAKSQSKNAAIEAMKAKFESEADGV